MVALAAASIAAISIIIGAFIGRDPAVDPQVAITDDACPSGREVCTITLLNIGKIPIQNGELHFIYRDGAGNEIGREASTFRSPFVVPGEYTTAVVHRPPDADPSRSEVVFTAVGKSTHPVEFRRAGT